MTDSTNSSEKPQRELSVLVVEDNPEAANLSVHFLESEGYRVQTARNGTEALMLAEQIHPDIVLLDIGLPGLDGLHVAKELKKKSPPIAIFAATGFSLPEDLARSRAAGIDRHFSKPLDFDALLAALAALRPAKPESL
jgi:two-component system, chemotaxis family, CheB/CheR fusion protein